MRLIARKRLRERLPWWRETPKRSEKPSIWAAARDYTTFSIAVAAFGVSIFTLYISHYGGPQDFRVTVYLPDVAIEQSAYVHNPDAQVTSAEQMTPDKISISGDMAFINSGSGPILVDRISYIIPVARGHIVSCEGYVRGPPNSAPWAVVDSSDSAFVVPPGQIITKRIAFKVFRSFTPDNDLICFQFTIVDRSGEERTSIVSGIRFVPDYGIDAPPAAFTQSGWAQKNTYVLADPARFAAENDEPWSRLLRSYHFMRPNWASQ